MTEWLRTFIFSALLTAVGSSPDRVTCEISQVLLAGGEIKIKNELL